MAVGWIAVAIWTAPAMARSAKPAPVPPAPPPALEVGSGEGENLTLEARHVPLEDALRAVADDQGFDLSISPRAGVMPLDLAVTSAPIEDVLRQMLRGTSYAVFYDREGGEISRVVVLSPLPAPTKPRVPIRRRR